MIDPTKIDKEEVADNFGDELLNGSAFKLESLESYPGKLPYQDVETAPEDASATADQTFVASLRDELERSRIQKSRGDSLEERIQLLRQQLKDDGAEPAQISNDSFELDTPDEFAPKDEHSEFLDQIDLHGSPVMMGAKQQPASEPEFEIDVDIPDVAETVPTDQKRKRKVFVYAAVASLVLAGASGAAYWWWLSPRASVTSEPAIASTNATTVSKVESVSPVTDTTLHQQQEDHGAIGGGKPETTQYDSSPESKSPASALAKDDNSVKPGSSSKPDQTGAGQSIVASGDKSKNGPESTPSHKAPEPERKPDKRSSHAALKVPVVANDHASKEVGKTQKLNKENIAATSPSDSKNLAMHEKKKPESLAQTHSEKVAGADKSSHQSSNSNTVGEVHKKEKPKVESDIAIRNETAPVRDPATPKETARNKNVESPENSKRVPATTDIQTQNLTAPKQQINNLSMSAIEGTHLIPKPVIHNAPSSPKGIFTVQVYASPSREDAEEWVGRLRTKNVESPFISMQNVKGTTYYRVRFGSYQTRDEAESAALKSGFASGWVDRVK